MHKIYFHLRTKGSYKIFKGYINYLYSFFISIYGFDAIVEKSFLYWDDEFQILEARFEIPHMRRFITDMAIHHLKNAFGKTAVKCERVSTEALIIVVKRGK